MLEDDFTHVLRKALRGLEMAPAHAAAAAGLENQAVLALLAGKFDAAAIRALAGALDLDADALAGHPEYQPPPLDDPAIQRLELPFGSDSVNAWLIDAGATFLLIDTGCDSQSLRQAIRHQAAAGKAVGAVCVTHDHADHTGGLGLFASSGIPIYGPGDDPRWRPSAIGDVMKIDNLRLKVVDLAGHRTPAIGLLIDGLGAPVFATGDAVFAGSIGGCTGNSSYATALDRMHRALAPLPGATWLLPGHGPASTVASEARHNPFIARMLDHIRLRA